MKYDNNESKPKKESIYDQFYGFNSVESSTELTGLTPSLPPSEDDVYSYSEIHGIPIQDYKSNLSKGKGED